MDGMIDETGTVWKRVPNLSSSDLAIDDGFSPPGIECFTSSNSKIMLVTLTSTFLRKPTIKICTNYRFYPHHCSIDEYCTRNTVQNTDTILYHFRPCIFSKRVYL